jgi:hypothetical protein
LFGQFQNAEVDRVATMLDEKLEAAIEYVQDNARGLVEVARIAPMGLAEIVQKNKQFFEADSSAAGGRE